MTQSDEETNEPLIAGHRNFYKVEQWTRHGQRVERLLFAGNSLHRARAIFTRWLAVVGGRNARPRRNSLRLRRWGPNTSVASRIHWISLGALPHRRRNDMGYASVSFTRAFRPPANAPGRR